MKRVKLGEIFITTYKLKCKKISMVLNFSTLELFSFKTAAVIRVFRCFVLHSCECKL